MNVRDYLGRPYSQNHGCLEFVKHVCEQERGLEPMSVEEFNIWLIDHQYEIKAPKEGDFVLMHSSEWHIGYMVDHERFMHCSRDLGAAMVSDINRNEYRNSIQGFYRVDI